MWIFTSDGFVSIVEDRHPASGDDRLLVRARRRDHLDAFLSSRLEDNKSIEITEDSSRDYRFRVSLPRHLVANLLIDHVLDKLDYGNFKNSVTDPDLKSTCGSVWHEVGKLQEGGPYNSRARHAPGLFRDNDED